MKLKFGLKTYEVTKITNLKDKILNKKDNDKILYYPNTNLIDTYFRKENYLVIATNLDYQVKYIYRNIPKNKFIHIKENKKNIHMFLIPEHVKEKIVVGSILKIYD